MRTCEAVLVRGDGFVLGRQGRTGSAMLRHLVWLGSVPASQDGKKVSFLPQPILPEMFLLLVKLRSSSQHLST